MTDPLRSDHLPEAGGVPERDPERERDARIESLLLAGLDHYFAGQHELAISVWTRVLFLDRGHARAKAYIDRARSAISERQREGDELLHTGAAAVDRGDAGAARSLLNSAVERGAASEEALVQLERLNRLEHANAPARTIASRPLTDTADDGSPASVDRSASSSRVVWVAIGVLAGLAVAGVVAWVGLTRPEWLPMNPAAIGPNTVQTVEPLPVPASAEIWLARARNYYEDGRLHDALTSLQAIAPTDPRKADADELKAAIQSRLLEAARKSPAPSQ
jgi:tetratricopeptide (TPR) repeat protein